LSHANKKGVRYRYYVSQAVLQNRKENAGSIARVRAEPTQWNVNLTSSKRKSRTCGCEQKPPMRASQLKSKCRKAGASVSLRTH
jgi:hypothetical protein